MRRDRLDATEWRALGRVARPALGWRCVPDAASNSNIHGGRRVSILGYTVVELVTVIVILAVIASIAGPRFFGTRTFSERGYADEVASALRYSQKIAVASGCNVRFAITVAGYSAMQQVASGNRCDSASAVWSTTVKRSDGAALAGTPPSDANVTAAATMTFDGKGAIVSGASNLSIGAYTLVVNAASGFVVVQ